jgi:hypothetical protein
VRTARASERIREYRAGRPVCGSSCARDAAPGAQLRFTDIGGHRLTAFATGGEPGARDRIRGDKDTAPRNLPPKGYAQNQEEAGTIDAEKQIKGECW